MLALVDNRPKVLSQGHGLLLSGTPAGDHITRRTQYELKKAEDRLHILEGFKIALDNLDAVINLIRKSRDADAAREGLMRNFSLSRVQAQAILDMRLHRLTGLEREKVEQEYREIQERIRNLKEILADPRKIDAIIVEELTEIADKYGDERRTRIVNRDGELEIEDLIADEDVVITITHQAISREFPSTPIAAKIEGDGESRL